MQNISKHVGQKVRLYCDITGDPWPNYIWKKDGRLLSSSSKRIATKKELFGSR